MTDDGGLNTEIEDGREMEIEIKNKKVCKLGEVFVK